MLEIGAVGLLIRVFHGVSLPSVDFGKSWY